MEGQDRVLELLRPLKASMGPAFCPDRLGAHRTTLLLLLCLRAFLSSRRWLSSRVSSGMVSSDLPGGPEWVAGLGLCFVNQNQGGCYF